MQIFKHQYKDRSGEKQFTKKWYVQLKDGLDRNVKFVGFSDRVATEELGRKIQRLISLSVAGEQPDAELVRWVETLPEYYKTRFLKMGIISQSRALASKGLDDLAAEWCDNLRNKGRSEKHVVLYGSRVRRVFGECKFSRWSEINSEKIQRWFSNKMEVGENGREGMSPQTVNHYMTALKGFCNWMVRSGRASSNPVVYLSRLNVRVDQRHERRALTHEEATRLLSFAYNGDSWRGVSGPERALVYRLALETGLRASEIRTLKRSSFELDSDKPSVTVEACYSKRRRRDVLPLLPRTAAALREYMRNKLPVAVAFENLPDKMSDMIRRDLEGAGVEYQDEGGRFADFHSLRHTFITNLANGGVHPKTAQALARHSSITLTMDRYSHSLLDAQRDALGKLPEFSEAGIEESRATGTSDESAKENSRLGAVLATSLGMKVGGIEEKRGRLREVTEVKSGVGILRNSNKNADKCKPVGIFIRVT